MNRYLSIVCSVVFVGLVALPGQILAASITPTKAAIGEGCVASGDNSTAMGHETTASGRCSTAMGYQTTASGWYATAMGYYTTASGQSSTAMGVASEAGGDYSFAGGKYMQLSDAADNTFVWGHSSVARPISASNSFLIFPAGTPGRVGIGTMSPQNLLDLGETQGKKLAVFQKVTGDDFYGFGIYPNTLEIYAGVPSGDDNPAMVVKKSTGNVGIGFKFPTHKLEVIGDAAKSVGGTTWDVVSDVRLKDITGEYARGLDEIVRLKPITFHYKEDNPRGLPSEDENIGFIAQEVQEVFPEAVNEGPDGYLDFNMHPVNVAMVNAVRELKAENEVLKAENTAMREDIARIKAALGM